MIYHHHIVMIYHYWVGTLPIIINITTIKIYQVGILLIWYITLTVSVLE